MRFQYKTYSATPSGFDIALKFHLAEPDIVKNIYLSSNDLIFMNLPEAIKIAIRKEYNLPPDQDIVLEQVDKLYAGRPDPVPVDEEPLPAELTTKEAIAELKELVFKFFTSRPLSVIRLTDIFKLIRLKYPDEPIIKKWRDLKRERFGSCPELGKALEEDKRFTRLSKGLYEVYFTLSK